MYLFKPSVGGIIDDEAGSDVRETSRRSTYVCVHLKIAIGLYFRKRSAIIYLERRMIYRPIADGIRIHIHHAVHIGLHIYLI